MTSPDFEHWCQQHGIRHESIQAGWVADGWRGVIATRTIAPGDVLLAVPQHLLISAQSARRDSQLAPLLVQHTQLTSYQVCAYPALAGGGCTLVLMRTALRSPGLLPPLHTYTHTHTQHPSASLLSWG